MARKVAGHRRFTPPPPSLSSQTHQPSKAMRPPVPTPLAPSAGTLCCGNRNGTGPCAQALSEIAAANPRLATPTFIRRWEVRPRR